MDILDYSPVPKRFKFMVGQTWKFIVKVNDTSGAINLNNCNITAIITAPQGAKEMLSKDNGISVSADGKTFVLRKDWLNIAKDGNDNVTMNPDLRLLPRGSMSLQIFITDSQGTDTTPVFIYVDVIETPSDSSEDRMNANTTIEVTLNNGVLLGVAAQPISDRIEWRRVGFRIDVRYIGESTWTTWADFSAINKGDTGLSAYELAVQQGFVGTIAEWLVTLKAPAGRQITSYNASTNTPALTAAPANGLSDGDYYIISNPGGTLGFAGKNFASGATCYEGDQLRKDGNQWLLVKYGYGQMMTKVTEAATSATQSAASATTATQKAVEATQKAAEATTQAAQALASANSAAAVAQGAVTTRPKRKSILNANFRSGVLPSDFEVVRYSNATAGGKKKRVVAAHEPRFQDEGILVENEQRINLMPYLKLSSLDGYFQRPFGAADTTDILGEMNGTNIVIATGAIYGSNSDRAGYTYTVPTTTVAFGTTITVSIYVKGIGNFYLGIQDSAAQYFVINSPDEYTRVSYTGVTLDGYNNPSLVRIFQLLLMNQNQPANASLSFCCAQIEVGSYASSYIKPTGIPTTRAQEILKTKSTFTVPTKGTVFLKTKRSDVATSSTLLEVRGEDTAGGWNVIRAYAENGYLNFDAVINGQGVSKQSTLVAAGATLNIAIAYKNGKMKFALNGVVTAEFAIASITVNRIISSPLFQTIIQDIIVYDDWLDDTELANITAVNSLFGREYNQGATAHDLGSVAFMDARTLAAMKVRNEQCLYGSGASQTINIRRPYDFYFVVTDSSGGSITTQPPSTLCSANTDYSLVYNFPVGKTLVYAIIPYTV
ncbi:hypothetical protein GOQ04_03380 [Emticicia sp. ODNR4P]|nr:hypothetical protein [Emticicia sp. ODNR4P]